MGGGRRARLAQEALERGAEHHRAGRWAEAARAYAEALKEEPGNVDALALLGGAALRMGRTTEALAVLDRAVAAAPDHAVARLNQGRALLALGRADDAEAAFAAAIAARPGFTEARLGRARALASAGRVDAAIAEAAGVAGVAGAGAPGAGATPGAVVEALALLGGLLVEAGRAAEAEAPLRRALASRPGDARILGDLGACLLAGGREEEAAAVWRRVEGAPRLDAARAALSRNLGLARLAAGSPDAVEWLREAVRLAPSDTAACLGLADALFQHPSPPPDATEELALLLDTDGIDHQRIERAVRAALGAVPGVPAAVSEARAEVDPAVAAALATHPLFTRWLTRTIVATPGWSRLVDRLRRHWLGCVLAGEAVDVGVLAALAVHAWHTEYAGADDDRVERLGATPTEALARAMFRPPGPEVTGLAALRDGARQEAAIAPTIPRLGDVTDATSHLVRIQYEENPYPRLVGIHRRTPGSFVAMARGLLGDPAYAEPARILVAGGGTGQHPIGVAAGVTGEVVCVDLSCASLARATRVARAHGVTNVRFVQGDLLALGPTDGLGVFDFVDCVGVLHHLADPAAGGRALVSKLAPGGILRLGLYSERGRSEVIAARALAVEHGWLPTDAGLRAARQALLALPAEHPAARVTASVDFYSQSGLRDLVFHPCEHRYTPAQVAELVTGLGLRVVALQHARPEALRLYQARWPGDAGLDLARWDGLEQESPRIFSGMIHVWCRAS